MLKNRLATAMAVVALSGLLMACCCPGPRSASDTAKREREDRPRPEEPRPESREGVVRADGVPGVFAATTMDAFDEMTRHSNHRDELAIRQMMNRGTVMVVPVGTKVRLVGGGLTTARVRLIDGPDAGREVLIASEFVK